MAQALLPLKDLVEAKSRLAGLLRPAERRALAQAMAEDVLSSLRQSDEISRVVMVSDDPGAEALCAVYGAECWSEASLGCRGLNPVIDAAATRMRTEADNTLLVLHADLPLLSAADIDAVILQQSQHGGLVIGPDRRGSGTNLLAFSGQALPEFRFGADSCSRHRAGASEAGIAASLVHRAGIGCDIDEPQDLKYLMSRMSRTSSSHTARLLCTTQWGARVGIALDSLPPAASSAQGEKREAAP
jgi:2-phospho-L-lactate guanylyltransferase